MKQKISVVVATRNDNYGGTLVHRFTNFLKQFEYIQKSFPNLFELVVVDWNSDPNNKKLEEIYNFKKIKNLQIIKFDNSYHKKISNGSNIPFFEYIAKNEGIKKASSKYVLTCTQDIIFSKKLLKTLNDSNLSDDFFYRVDRIDFDLKNNFKISNDLLLNEIFFNKNITSIQSRQNFFITIFNSLSKKFIKKDLFYIYSTKMSYEMETKNSIVLNYKDDFLNLNKFILDLYKFLYDRFLNNNNLIYGYFLRFYSLILFRSSKLKYIHNLCSGDFILTNKNNFINSKIFITKIGPQLHIDTLGVFQLFKHGIGQIIFNNGNVIYHQNHQTDDINIRNSYHSSIMMNDLFKLIF